MARWWLFPLLALALWAAPARAEDLSSRLEELQRQSQSARPVDPDPAPDPTAGADPGPPAAAAAPSSRLTQIQERRAREYRELAVAAARRLAKAAETSSENPASEAQRRADERERDHYSRMAEDVFRPGTETYQAAYDEWLASEAP